MPPLSEELMGDLISKQTIYEQRTKISPCVPTCVLVYVRCVCLCALHASVSVYVFSRAHLWIRLCTDICFVHMGMHRCVHVCLLYACVFVLGECRHVLVCMSYCVHKCVCMCVIL